MTNAKIQELLNKDGASLVVDGQLGPASKAAIKTFQRRYGLSADGNVGIKTLAELTKIDKRKFKVYAYDYQTFYIVYLKSDVEAIELYKANGTAKFPKEQVKSFLKRIPTPDILINGTMFDMTTGGVLGEVHDEGIRTGYNPFDPLTFVVRKNGEMSFMHENNSRKLKDIKDTFSFAPMMYMNGEKCKTYGRNLSKAFLTTAKEPRNGFFETKDYFIHVFVNGRTLSYRGVTIPQFFMIAQNVAWKLGQKIENGGNLDSGYSLAGFVKGVQRTNTGIITRPISNVIGFYLK